MAFPVILHIENSDAIMADMEEKPDPNASVIVCTNLRTKDGKPVVYVDQEAREVYFPWHKVSFLEILPGSDDKEEFETFFRD